MIPYFFFGFFDGGNNPPPEEPNLFGGVAHFKKLHERSLKPKEIEVVEVVEIPQEVKEVITKIADTSKKQSQLDKQLKAQLKALEIQFRQEYIDALKTEMIRQYLIAEQERQEEEESIAMMMIALTI